jgi:AcrR family transcriptional regulator
MVSKRPKTPRKLPQQSRSRFTVDAILEATAHILVEEGYDKASTNRIAERAGVSIGSLYQYFPNKEALMAALMQQHSSEIAELVESHLQDLAHQPPAVVVPALVKAVIAAHRLNPHLHQVLSEEIPRSERLGQMQQTEQRILTLLRQYLSRWSDQIVPQNLDMTIFMVSRTVETLCHAAVIEPTHFVSDPDFEQQVSQMLLAYLTQRP